MFNIYMLIYTHIHIRPHADSGLRKAWLPYSALSAYSVK